MAARALPSQQPAKKPKVKSGMNKKSQSVPNVGSTRHLRAADRGEAQLRAYEDKVTDYTDMLDLLQLDRRYHEEFFRALCNFRQLPGICEMLVSPEPNVLEKVSKEFLKTVGKEYWVGNQKPRIKKVVAQNETSGTSSLTNQDKDHYGDDDEDDLGDEGDKMDVDEEGKELRYPNLHDDYTKFSSETDHDHGKRLGVGNKSALTNRNSHQFDSQNFGDDEASPSDRIIAPNLRRSSQDHKGSMPKKPKHNDHREKDAVRQKLRDRTTQAQSSHNQSLFRSAALGLRCRDKSATKYSESTDADDADNSDASDDRNVNPTGTTREGKKRMAAGPRGGQIKRVKQEASNRANLRSRYHKKSDVDDGLGTDAEMRDPPESEGKIIKLKPGYKGKYLHWRKNHWELISRLIPIFERMRQHSVPIPEPNETDKVEFSEVEGGQVPIPELHEANSGLIPDLSKMDIGLILNSNTPGSAPIHVSHQTDNDLVPDLNETSNGEFREVIEGEKDLIRAFARKVRRERH